MPQVLVWKCPKTGTLFEDITAYRTHLRAAATASIAKRKKDHMMAKLDDTMAELQTCGSFAEIRQWLLDHPEELLLNAMRSGNFVDYRKPSSRRRKEEPPRLIDVTFSPTWRHNLSNSHSAPVGRKQNWGSRVPDAPTSYPGWGGSIEMIFNDDRGWCRYDPLKGTVIYCGGGGGGGRADGTYRLTYEIRVWAEDFPIMAHRENRRNHGLAERRMTITRKGRHICPLTRSHFDNEFRLRRGEGMVTSGLRKDVDLWLRETMGLEAHDLTEADAYNWDETPTGSEITYQPVDWRWRDGSLIPELPAPRYLIDSENQRITFARKADHDAFKARYDTWYRCYAVLQGISMTRTECDAIADLTAVPYAITNYLSQKERANPAVEPFVPPKTDMAFFPTERDYVLAKLSMRAGANFYFPQESP